MRSVHVFPPSELLKSDFEGRRSPFGAADSRLASSAAIPAFMTLKSVAFVVL
jgi:hypothetical protein